MRYGRTLLVGFLALVVLVGFVAAARATVRGFENCRRTEYSLVCRIVYETEDYGPRLVVRGIGCLQTEDSTTLELVEWTGVDGKAVYQCVTP